MYIYKIADVIVEADLKYSYAVEMCRDYEYTGSLKPQMKAYITQADIDREREYNSFQKIDFPDCYLESMALFRKINDYLSDRGEGCVFHSSSVVYKDNGYMFIGPSGAGKSTHARLWKEYFNGVYYLNDDKPIIRKKEDGFYAYGTPWMGKHNLGVNECVKIKAICEVNKSKTISISKVNKIEMLPAILNQMVRPEGEEKMDKLFSIVEGLINSVNLYKLYCDISEESAKTSFKEMTGETI